MDSMAVYCRMDIGTAKPSAQEQARIPHHLIDLVEPHVEFSASDYVRHAESAIDGILSRGHVPLFVGGTGLYLRSLLRGIFEGPQADPDLRDKLTRQAKHYGNAWLHNELAKVDQITAARLHPNDMRRIIRALEVFRLTGTPLSSLHEQHPLPPEERPLGVFWLDPPRDWLYDRVNGRVDLMMRQGLLEETRQLLASVPAPGRTARQALGYRELIRHLELGTPLCQAVEDIKTGTRQFAKRQHTWFRNLEECTAVPVTGLETPAELAERLLTSIG